MVNRIADHFRQKRLAKQASEQKTVTSAAKAGAERLLESLEGSVRKHPGEWLAAAFALGTLAALWIKRR